MVFEGLLVMSRTFMSNSPAPHRPSKEGERGFAAENATGTGPAATLLDTTSNASISGVLNDPVWGEPSFASLWDDAGGDTFVFRADAAEDDAFSEFHAGDKLDLDWGGPDAGSTLTLVIGPTFTGAGQLIIHADGNQTYVESNPMTSDGGDAGATGIPFSVFDVGGGDC